jgi:ABC-type uncharacterized transport system ATPase subunit
MLGPNGAGKTTTVGLFEGLRVPDAGVVEVPASLARRRPLRARWAFNFRSEISRS